MRAVYALAWWWLSSSESVGVTAESEARNLRTQLTCQTDPQQPLTTHHYTEAPT